MPFDATPIANPIVELLREGRKIVENGWGQGVLYEAGRVCMIGGIACAADRRIIDRGTFIPREFEPKSVKTYRAALGYLERASNASPLGIPNWNDAPERSQADVLAAYDKAIDLAICAAFVPQTVE